jgi:hypothetical protein
LDKRETIRKNGADTDADADGCDVLIDDLIIIASVRSVFVSTHASAAAPPFSSSCASPYLRVRIRTTVVLLIPDIRPSSLTETFSNRCSRGAQWNIISYGRSRSSGEHVVLSAAVTGVVVIMKMMVRLAHCM